MKSLRRRNRISGSTRAKIECILVRQQRRHKRQRVRKDDNDADMAVVSFTLDQIPQWPANGGRTP